MSTNYPSPKCKPPKFHHDWQWNFKKEKTPSGELQFDDSVFICSVCGAKTNQTANPPGAVTSALRPRKAP